MVVAKQYVWFAKKKEVVSFKRDKKACWILLDYEGEDVSAVRRPLGSELSQEAS